MRHDSQSLTCSATVCVMSYLRCYSFELSEADGASFRSVGSAGCRAHISAIAVSRTNTISTKHSLVSADIVVTSLVRQARTARAQCALAALMSRWNFLKATDVPRP